MANFGFKNQGDLWGPWDNLNTLAALHLPAGMEGDFSIPQGQGGGAEDKPGTQHLLLHGLL